MDFIKSPKAIEDKSMDLINPFIMDIDLTPEEVTVYSRMIHASGDVDYGHLIQTSKGAVAAGIEALAKGCNIYTDVNMVKAGINKNALHALGSEVFCRVSDPEIAAIAKEKGIARSMAAMNSFGTDLNGSIIAVGNAPTALYEAIRMVEEDGIKHSSSASLLASLAPLTRKSSLYAVRPAPSSLSVAPRAAAPSSPPASMH